MSKYPIVTKNTVIFDVNKTPILTGVMMTIHEDGHIIIGKQIYPKHLFTTISLKGSHADIKGFFSIRWNLTDAEIEDYTFFDVLDSCGHVTCAVTGNVSDSVILEYKNHYSVGGLRVPKEYIKWSMGCKMCLPEGDTVAIMPSDNFKTITTEASIYQGPEMHARGARVLKSNTHYRIGGGLYERQDVSEDSTNKVIFVRSLQLTIRY